MSRNSVVFLHKNKVSREKKLCGFVRNSEITVCSGRSCPPVEPVSVINVFMDNQFIRRYLTFQQDLI